MIAYLDSSILLRVVLGQRSALKKWGRVTQGIASALAEVECLRTLDRLRVAQGFADEMIAEQREAVYRLLEVMEIVEITTGPVTRCPTAPDGIGNPGRDPSCYGVAVDGASGKGPVDGYSRRGIGRRREGKRAARYQSVTGGIPVGLARVLRTRGADYGLCTQYLVRSPTCNACPDITRGPRRRCGRVSEGS